MRGSEAHVILGFRVPTTCYDIIWGKGARGQGARQGVRGQGREQGGEAGSEGERGERGACYTRF